MLSFDVVINSAFEENLEKAVAYAKRLSATIASSKTGHAFINGKHIEYNDVSALALEIKRQLKLGFSVCRISCVTSRQRWVLKLNISSNR